jgi:hypothetical protein
MGHCRCNSRSRVPLPAVARDHRCCGVARMLRILRHKGFCCLRHQTHFRMNNDKEISDEDLTKSVLTEFNPTTQTIHLSKQDFCPNYPSHRSDSAGQS